MADDVARQGIYDRGVTAPSTPEMPRLSSSRRSLALDVVVAVVLLTCGLALLWFQYDQNNGTILPGVDAPDRNLAMIGLSLVVVPVAVRRLAPIGALALGAVAFVVVRWILVPEYQVTSIALFLLLYGAGRWSDRPRVRNGARAIAVVGLLVVLIRSLILEWDAFVGVVMSASRFALVAGVGLTFNVVFVLTSVLAGELARGRADRERDLAIRTLELQAEREENARRAVLDERVRIARELHDVVAHHVSVMGVQAGAARRVMSTQPAAAAEALEAVEESSRQAVVELHRLLGFLRDADETDGLDPTPELDRLDELVASVRSAGLDVELEIAGDPRSVPGSVGVSAYRIVQEALTNVLRHARADRATVCVRYEPTRLVVSIVDDGRGGSTNAEPTTGGNGLRGMGERAALVGGSVTHGPNPGGGFRVRAELPTAAMPRRAPLDAASNGAAS